MERSAIDAGGFKYTNAYQSVITRQQTQVIWCYLIITILLYIDRWLNGMLMSQLNPSFFVSRMDVSSWLFMYTGIHKVFIESQQACIVADVLLIVLPLTYVALYLSNKRQLVVIIAWLILLFNWIYTLCYVMYPSNSIEGHVGWLLFPFVLICSNPVNFSFALRFIRYVLLFFFATAGIWKIRSGGLFYDGEMSGILLLQHKDFLITSPESHLTAFYYWLIQHPLAGYGLYIASALLELFFLVGFFTRKMDRVILLLLFIFLFADVVVMRIKYWEILYLVVPLFFSKKEIMQHS